MKLINDAYRLKQIDCFYPEKNRDDSKIHSYEQGFHSISAMKNLRPRGRDFKISQTIKG